MKKIFICLFVLGLLISACSNDDLSSTMADLNPKTEVAKKEKNMTEFATILSKVVYNNKSVRQFLKDEAVKQFDRNYDILYYAVKNKDVDGRTFRDILISYSSAEAIEEIERNVPLLNILLPKIKFFNVFPEELNVEDNEIPIAFAGKEKNILFLDGKKELSLNKGEVPNFHVFVVNENSRVIVPNSRVKSSGTFRFKSPNYDGERYKQRRRVKSLVWADFETIGGKAFAAHQYFYKDDGSINQKAFQRDYIYYGITPEKQQGSLNHSVSEYISYIKIGKDRYKDISDQDEKGLKKNDPKIITSKTSKKKRELTHEELMDRLWTKGSFNFRFEVISGKGDHPQIVFVPLKPDEIWDFNLHVHRRHSTGLRRSKYTYTIDPSKFTPKKVYLGDNEVPIGKWNLEQDGLYKYIKVYEEDEGAEITETETYENSFALKTTVNGGIKFNIGLAKADVSAGVESENTTKKTISYTIKRKQESDFLGAIKIYFYDPIVEKGFYDDFPFYGVLHTYSTGAIEFGITVK